MKLHGYFRSSAAYRVRIALNLKGIECEMRAVNLREGEQLRQPFTDMNAQALVPVLDTGTERLIQSLAICEYLDEIRPDPPLLPSDPAARARARALADIVACDVHPLNNLRVLKYLGGELGVSEDDRQRWYHHWVHEGFRAVEATLNEWRTPGPYCTGDQVTLADVCLVPQVYNAHRFQVDMSDYPRIRSIHEACEALPAFKQAHPDNQPDAV